MEPQEPEEDPEVVAEGLWDQVNTMHSSKHQDGSQGQMHLHCRQVVLQLEPELCNPVKQEL